MDRLPGTSGFDDRDLAYTDSNRRQAYVLHGDVVRPTTYELHDLGDERFVSNATADATADTAFPCDTASDSFDPLVMVTDAEKQYDYEMVLYGSTATACRVGYLVFTSASALLADAAARVVTLLALEPTGPFRRAARIITAIRLGATYASFVLLFAFRRFGRMRTRHMVFYSIVASVLLNACSAGVLAGLGLALASVVAGNHGILSASIAFSLLVPCAMVCFIVRRFTVRVRLFRRDMYVRRGLNANFAIS